MAFTVLDATSCKASKNNLNLDASNASSTDAAMTVQ